LSILVANLLFIITGSYKRLQVVFVLEEMIIIEIKRVFSFENIGLVVKPRVVQCHIWYQNQVSFQFLAKPNHEITNQIFHEPKTIHIVNHL
jgi:hypothetical protein